MADEEDTRKDTPEKPDCSDAAVEPAETALPPAIIAAVANLAEAQHLGLFLGDRPLLDCPACRLQEDVLFDGRLVVRYAQNNAVDSDEEKSCPMPPF